jgi:hypothetical protein
MKLSPSIAVTPLAERTAAARMNARQRRIAGDPPPRAARMESAAPTTPASRRRMRQHAAALDVKPLVHGSDPSHR